MPKLRVSFLRSRQTSSFLSSNGGLDTDFASAEYVAKYATKENVDDAGNDSDDSDRMSSVGSLDEDEEDEEAAGTMDDV